MGKPFEVEMNQLPSTYAWAMAQPIEALTRSVGRLQASPLLAVGSGGSFSVCHFICHLHGLFAGQPALPMSPLQAVASRTRASGMGITEQLDGGTLDRHSETANLASLFAEQGAAADAAADSNESDLHRLVDQRERLGRLAAAAGWRPVQPKEDFRSAILLLGAPQAAAQSDPDDLRRAMLEGNVVVSSYHGGRLRISAPGTFTQEHWSMLHNALVSCR